MGVLPRVPGANGALLPSYRILLPGTGDQVKAKILNVQANVLSPGKPLARFTGDQPLMSLYEDASGDATAAQVRRGINALPESDWVRLSHLGKLRGVEVSALQIQPARYNVRTGEVTCLSSLELEIRFPESGAPGQRRAVLPVPYPELTGSLALPAFVSPSSGPPPRSNAAGETRLKIYISEEGLYHLSYGKLASWGADLNADPRTFRLENRGEEVPIYVFGEADGRFDESDYIEFWGEGLHGTYTDQNPEIYSDLYTDVNVYWLSWGGDLGARLIEESGEIVEVDPLKMVRAVSYPYFVHSEQNQYFNRLSQVGADSLKEHWYWDSGVHASETRDYNVFLPYPDQDALTNVSVRVALMGLTYPDPNTQLGGQHHVYVSLNDQSSPALEAGSSGASWWVGQTGVILLAQGGAEGISPSHLNHGTNQISIFVPEDTDAGANDTVLLNWFEITYPRLYKAYNNKIRFQPPEAAVDTLVDFRITEFESPNVDIFKLGQSKIINAQITPYQGPNGTLYEVHFQDRPFGARDYVAVTPTAKMLPDSVELDPGSDILTELSAGSPVKLLVIAHRSFEGNPELEAYLARRNAELGRTELVFIDDVFDELSDGIYDPQAIKDLLQALPQPPEFLLLVGDGSYDTRDRYGYGGNLIPVHFIQTFAYGSVASDFWYSLLDDDLMPDLAVGRISARDNGELSDYLQKLEQYETQTESGSWRNSHLFVTGTGGAGDISFLTQSQNVIEYLDDQVFVERLATDPISSPFFGTTTDLIDLFDEGVLVIDYNGHGAGAIWSDNSLFRLENLPQLSNQARYPFVTNFTCFIGAFDTPQPDEILGEEFIFEPEKGAIAVMASTGLGWFYNGGWLQESLVDLLYDNTSLRLGEIINAAKIAYYAYYGQGGSVESFDTMHLMNLLGDPSLRLAFAERTEEPPEVSPWFTGGGDSVHVFLSGDYAAYQGVLRVYDENDYPALQYGEPYEAPLIPSTDGIGADFILPELGDSTVLTGGSYRLCLWEPGTETTLTTGAPLYLLDAYTDSSVVDSLSSDPSPVDIWDAFALQAKILDAQGVASAVAHFRIETNEGVPIVEHDSLEMAPADAPDWYKTVTTIDTTMYPYGVEDRVIAWLVVVDAEGDTTTSNELIFYILNRQPDPDWEEGSLAMAVKDSVAALTVKVTNFDPEEPWITGMDIDSLDVAFYLLPEGGGEELLGSVVLYDLLMDSSAEAAVPVNFAQPEVYNIEVRMNEQGWINDFHPTDPYTAEIFADHFNVSTESGTGDTLMLSALLDTTGGDSTFLTAWVYIPPQGLSGGSGVLTFGLTDALELSPFQSDMSFAYHNAAYQVLPGYGLILSLSQSLSIIADSLYLAMDLTRFDSSLVIQDVRVHHQAEGSFGWQAISGEMETLTFPPDPQYRFWVKTGEEGYFTLLQNGDHQGPILEFSVEGQIYTERGYVSRTPKISVSIQDLGGVNFNPETFWMRLDGEEVTPLVNDENSGQVMTLSINPTLAVGSHTVAVSAQDLAGNAVSDSIQFKVTGQFRLDFLGNYPNPFKDKTYFTYRLTEQTTSPVEIRIYTVSGRLIRVLHSDAAAEINYGEIYWDGTDRDGEPIANGVYFYKFTARRGDEKIERTMKLAKLR